MPAEPSSESKTEPASGPGSPPEVGRFAQNGECLAPLVVSTFVLNGFEGLNYAQLPPDPVGREFAVGLSSIAGDPVGPEGALPIDVRIRRGLSDDAGETLDAQANRQYGRRQHKHPAMIGGPSGHCSQRLADQIEGEIELLKLEIKGAVRIGGTACFSETQLMYNRVKLFRA